MPPNFKIFFFKNLYCPKGPLQHIKNLGGLFLISGSYNQKGVLTARQKQILEFDLFFTETVNQNGTKYVLQEALHVEQCAMSHFGLYRSKIGSFLTELWR